jgi:NADH-quinone oxidoreductase subunit L
MSQIGYMFLALGVGAWPAAMFHFLTHAVFKALLFLSAGAVAMRLHHEQNIFQMGGLRKQIPLAFWSFIIGAAALAALPVVTAGFFSKEFLLGSVWAAAPLLWGAGIAGALVTAIYIFRAVFTVFFGPVVTPVSGAYRWRVGLPLAVLGVGAIFIGWLQAPGFLFGGVTVFSQFLAPSTKAAAREAVPLLISAAGCLVPLLGIGIAWALHRNGFWQARAVRDQGFMAWAFSRGFDALYIAALVRPYEWTVKLLRNDPVDAVSTVLEHGAILLHRRLRATQNGQLRRYAAWITAGSIATIAVILFA